MTTLAPLKPQNISCLQGTQTLFSSDFRAIGESLNYDIPAMWKYENLLPWILNNQLVAVNHDYKDLKYPVTNQYTIASRSPDSKLSLLRRLQWPMVSSVKSLWVAIPHPDTDALAQEYNLNLNYTYKDFLQKNDKIRQKELLGDSSPSWQVFRSITELEKVAKKKKTGFIKRQYGSGGYTVFPVSSINTDQDFKRLAQDGEWYLEEYAEGIPCSIQCVHLPQDDATVIFGYSKQLVADSKFFIGSSLLPLSELADVTLNQLKVGIERLQPLLKGYEGFFGLDFIIGNDGKVHILEANIRVTAVTIPTLLMNMSGYTAAEFREDVPEAEIDIDTVVLAKDNSENKSDTLRFFPSKQQLGTSFFLDLQECHSVPIKLTDNYIAELARQVTLSMGNVVSRTSYNFWPHGWTVCFVLESSHCVLSAWYLEKRVLIDTFSCAPNMEGSQIQSRFTELFNSSKPGSVFEQIRK